MRRVLFLVCVSVLVAGCSSAAPETAMPSTAPPASASATTPAPTVTSVPPTATPVPPPVALEAILIEDGDLPSGYAGGQLRDEAPGMFRDVPQTARLVAYQQLQKGGETKGGVTVLVFDSEVDVNQAFEIIAAGFGSGTETVAGLGEQAIKSQGVRGMPPEVLFKVCQTVAHIRMTETDEAGVLGYAKRLAKRLPAAVCVK